MKRLLIALTYLLASSDLMAAQQSCPKFAPAAWGIGQKPLDTVRVMSYRRGTQQTSDRGQFDGPPWEEREEAKYLYQTWHMNTDAPAFIYEVDCVYANTERYVSLDVASAKKCIGRWRARADHGVVPFSLEFSCDGQKSRVASRR